MTAIALGECHPFEAAGRRFLYLVPSAAVFALDDTSAAVVDTLRGRQLAPAELMARLAGRFEPAEVEATLSELAGARAILPVDPARPAEPPPAPAPNIIPLTPIPLSTLVVNVTNRCNLSCAYCYEYGEDKIAEPTAGGMPKLMSEETARASVDFMIERAGSSPVVRLTFFGGETLLNWRVIRPTVEYAREQAQQAGKRVDFSLTTNATLLTREVSQWIADNGIGVTISVDGDKQFQDSMRVYRSGMGSYDVIAPRIAEFLKLQKRPVGARVTVTSKNLDVPRIFEHLMGLGFYEVGFAPVTSSPDQDYALGEDGFDELLDQFRDLADDYVEAATEGRYLGFSNLSDLLGEIHEGVSKAYPCGAGLGLVGVAPGGEVGLCHRFAGSGDHDLGHVATGIDDEKRAEHLQKAHIDARTDCSQCWVRSLCSGGCYHEAQVRYGDRFRPNLHYCDWIRDWTALGLSAYGRILDQNPRFLTRFEGMVRVESPTP
jgi:uncharacterized protein